MNSLRNCISLTTGVLIIYVVLANMPVAFGVVFLFFLLSEGLLLWMVFRILKEKRTSTKTFDSHFYEDVD
jgi:Flp pilus assembly protein TadB